MSAAAKRAVAHTSRQLLYRHSRRLASHSAPHRESAHHVPGGHGSESFGKGFYISLSLVPLGLVGWTMASSSESDPWLTRVIQSFRQSREELDRRNALHQAAAEQAASDRQLFATADSSSSIGYEVRYPEALNRSSPWNVVAGQGGADLSQLMEHYAKANEKAEQDRLGRMKDGKVKTVYDDTTGGRFPSWVPMIGSSKKVEPGYRE